ncbi:FecR protein [Arenibacter palladensis]|uniref:FecR protein n=1 Tax=Arenibacter palladensis TaxID=237373 RepID=A0A1M5ETN9_9FLAO|nr:FecR domain-containing protein [Arenibacter palladensis]SHF82635.1 FecR protein [Arenibacter palladensis]
MKTLVLKYLANEISEEELVSLKIWLKKPENQASFKEFIKSNQELDLAFRQIDSEKAYRRILEETLEKESVIRKIYIPILKYAAVIILLLATTFLIYTNVEVVRNTKTDAKTDMPPQSQITLELGDGSVEVLEDYNNKTISNKIGSAVVVKQEKDKLKYESVGAKDIELTYNKLTVPFGKRFEIELSDGTVIQLNAGTILKYPVTFSDPNSRDVYLEGEAFFSVQKNPEHPFIVHTKNMNVRVLGTKFNVSSYENEDTTSTVLLEGSVKVLRPNENDNLDVGTIISPNQQAAIQYGELSVEEVDVEKYIAWTQGILYFDNDRFADIVKELERHYNVKILNKYQELNSVRYTGTFQYKTISQVLEVFKRNTQFEYKLNNELIIIEPSL